MLMKMMKLIQSYVTKDTIKLAEELGAISHTDAMRLNTLMN